MRDILNQSGAANDPQPLPPPGSAGGMPLMEVLRARRSSREFSGKPLPLQVLSDLLWAASGVNRPESGQRTAPSARDWREIDVYVVTASGVDVYVPQLHALRRLLDRDLRAVTGRQDFPGVAPLDLVYVADYRRMTDATEDLKPFYAATDTGFIAQNVYLYCASSGLGAVVRGAVDRAALSGALGLGAHQHITLAQTVGYPAD